MSQLPLFPDIPPPEEKTVIPKIQTDSDFWKHHYSPKTFGSYIGQDEDTVCSKIERGKIKAINLNPGGIKARYAIPKDELDKFKPEKDRYVTKWLDYLNSFKTLFEQAYAKELANKIKSKNVITPKKEPKFNKKSALKLLEFKNENRCEGCAAEHDDILCSDMPICSDGDNSVIFKEVE